VDFGFECPDFFELPLDGDEGNRKWVLQDANGSYLVGAFDGTHFRKDPKQDTLVMTQGPDFYAGQTFPMGNLPGGDPRVIQIAWMDHWNGGVGETVWERNATFPVVLGLVTDQGQQRVTRLPIQELSDLYERTEKWGSQTIMKGENILSKLGSKKFDLIAEFDLKNSSASQIQFQIANKAITYNVHEKTLLGEPCFPDNSGHLRMHILVDWGQLEIFVNKGVYSYSEQFAFTPYRDDMGLFTDGELKLESLEFHEIKRIW
jgi:levanase/fructan beta-fructosidase